jgi:RHS repeat-associated protein
MQKAIPDWKAAVRRYAPATLIALALAPAAQDANKPPTVTLTAPAEGAVYQLNASVGLSANASDSDGQVAKVDFYRGATLVGSAAAAPYTAQWIAAKAGSYTLLGAASQAPYGLIWNNVQPGSHILSAKATDDRGAATQTAPVNISVTAALPHGVFYIHPDHLGTPRAVTDESDRIVWRNDLLGEPFGNAAPDEDPDGDGQKFEFNLRFPGQYYDRETGLSYNYFRDYDPGTGRYIQSDPIGLQGGVNTYTYANQNPLRFIDPLGLSGDDPLGGGGSASPPVGFPDPSAQAQQQLAKQLTQMLNQLLCPTNNCPPCTPYAAGTIGYIGPHNGHDHWPVGRPHLNLFQVNQNSTCKCFWNKLKDAAAPPPLPGWVDLNSGFPGLSP